MGIFNRRPDVKKMLQKRDVNGLMKALEYRDQTVQLNAAFALANIGYGPAQEPFIRTLRRADFSVEADKAKLLKGLKDAKYFVPILKNVDPNMRWNATQILVTIGSPAVKPLIGALQDPDWSVCGLATVALEKIGTPAVEPLIETLNDANPNARWAAAVALGEIGDPRAIDPLTNTLQDKNSSVQRVAREALAQIQTRAAAKIICTNCGSEMEPGKTFCTQCGTKLGG
jgi:HEAT repeat protein